VPILVLVLIGVFSFGIWFALTINGGNPQLVPITPRAAGAKADAVVFGDSVVVQSQAELRATLGGRMTQKIIAYPGLRTDQLLPLVKKEVAVRQKTGAPLDQAVFLVGYNDLMQNGGQQQAVDQLLNQGERFRCTLWLTLPMSDGGRRTPNTRLDPAQVERWNAMVHAKVGQHPRFRVVTAWQNQVEADSAGTLLMADDVHPTPAGRTALAQVINTSLQQNCG
jgi:lysophospholipase L1-like esterase